MKCVILQPSYIPWRGYFHQIALADVFIFYDDVQYDKRGWRNRNKIKTPDGTPEGKIWGRRAGCRKGAQTERIPINQIRIDWSKSWNEQHWSSLKHAYAKAPYFQQYNTRLEKFYSHQPDFLADFTIALTIEIASWMGFKPKFLRSSDIPSHGEKTERLISILQEQGADHYISGPSAKDYIDPALFSKAGIKLEYMQYNYPDYPQLYPPFDGQVSTLDLLFMTGDQAVKFIIGNDHA